MYLYLVACWFLLHVAQWLDTGGRKMLWLRIKPGYKTQQTQHKRNYGSRHTLCCHKLAPATNDTHHFCGPRKSESAIDKKSIKLNCILALAESCHRTRDTHSAKCLIVLKDTQKTTFKYFESYSIICHWNSIKREMNKIF